MGKAKRRLAQSAFEAERKKNLTAVPGPLDCALLLDTLKPDFNVGKIFRSADVLGCREVELVGIPWFDVAPARGSFRHVPSVFHEKFDQAYQSLKGKDYTLVALHPRDAELMTETELPEKCAFVLGNEGVGFSADLDQYSDIKHVKIPQYGKAESLNVSVAAAVALYGYVRQQAGDTPLAPPKTDNRTGRGR